MTDKNINWDATAFFASLTETNKFAKAHDFVFAKVSGLDGFEEALQQLQSATAIIAVSDISQGYIEVNNSPHTRRVKTVFLVMRHAIDDMAARQQCMDTMLAFNDTMLKIWREQMTLLGVIDTGRLLHSPKSLPVRADGRFIELGLSQSFLESGLWQNFGTGKEIPRGNHGDIGRERKRKKKLWFSRKYYVSVMNLRDFLSDNIAHEFVGVVAQALNDKYVRYNH